MTNFDWVPEELKGRFSYVNGRLVASCEVCGATKQTSGRGSVLKYISEGKIDRFRFCSIHGNFLSAKPSPEDIASWPEGHKRCRRCLEVKPFAAFHRHKDCLFGYNVECKSCRLPKSKKHYESTSVEYRMFSAAKYRAQKFGREFSISVEDVIIPEVCPVLGVKISYLGNSSPSLDRINSSLGYTKDNIRVISKRANTLKNNMTPEEARLIYLDLTSS